MPSKRSINDINRRTANKYNVHVQNAAHPAYGQENYQSAGDYTRNAAGYHAAAKKSGRGKKVAIILIAAFALVLAGLGTAFGIYVNNVSNALNKGDKSDEELMQIQDALGYQSNLNEVFYVLLVGSDARPTDTMSRSDTNIVVRVDPKENKLSMLSIPRDTKVEIEGHGTQKFNTAYAFDKIPGVIKATEDLIDVDISHYAEVNFESLKDLVDAVGGVTVENESKIDNKKCDDGDGNHYVIPEGTVTLNGGEALTFARNRDYPTGDFVRTSHQRQLVEAIIKSVINAPITSIPGIIQAAAECVTTDFALLDLIGLAQQFADVGNITVYNAMLPCYMQNINGISFVIEDEEASALMLEKFFAGEDPSGIVASKTVAPSINDKKVDTSKVVIFNDDDSVASGNKKPTVNPGGSSQGGSSDKNPSGQGDSSSGTTGGNTGGDNPSGGNTGGNTGGDNPSGGNTGDTGGNTSGGGHTEQSHE